MRFHVFEGKDGRWYWHAVPLKGGRQVADGSDGYARRANAVRAAWRFVISIRTKRVFVDGDPA